MADLNQQRKRDPRTGEVYDAGRDLDQDLLAREKQQDTAGLGSLKPKPVAQSEEGDESKMSGMALAAYRAKKARERASMTGADAAAALASRK